MMTLFEILEAQTKPRSATSKSTKDKGAVKAAKSRVRIYATIAQALSRGKVGEIFSTKGSDRLYVISKADWGLKSKGKIAKGFTPGSATPSAQWSSVKAHSVRTMLKHGSAKSGYLLKKYGPGAEDKIKNSKKAVTKSKDK